MDNQVIEQPNKTKGTGSMDIQKFRKLMQEDNACKGIDLDAVIKTYSDFVEEHGEALDALFKQEGEISAEMTRLIHTGNAREMRQEILDRELQETGIDWVRFHAGKKDEHEAVDKYMRKLNMNLTAATILSGEALTNLSQNGQIKSEGIRGPQANAIANFRGSEIENFLVQRANAYQQLKSAAHANDLFSSMSIMFRAGILGFGEHGTSTAGHALSAGGSIVHAIMAGVIAIGLPEVAVIATAFFAIAWVIVLILGKNMVMYGILNRTECALVIDDVYTLHGKTPVTPYDSASMVLPGQPVSAPPELRYGNETNTFMGYYFQEGNSGFVGVNGAYELDLRPVQGFSTSNGLNGSTLRSGYAIDKFAGSYILSDITNDSSSHAFYQRHFHNSDSYASNGTVSITTRLNAYPGSWSLKHLYGLSVVSS